MQRLIRKVELILLTFFLLSVSSFSQTKGKITIFTTETSKRYAKHIKHKLKTDPKNAELWNSLGLELLYQREFKKAGAALENALSFEPSNSGYLSSLQFAHIKINKPRKIKSAAVKAIRKNPSDSRAYFRRSIVSFSEGNWKAALEDAENTLIHEPRFAPGFALKSEILLRQFGELKKEPATNESLVYLKESVKVLETCLEVCEFEKSVLEKAIAERREFVSYFEKSLREREEKVNDSSEPMKLRSKTRPGITPAALRLGVQGTVRLAVMFKPDGTVGPVMVLQGIPGGLIEKSILAARQIKFDPAKKNGKAVNVVKTIAYNFRTF